MTTGDRSPGGAASPREEQATTSWRRHRSPGIPPSGPADATGLDARRVAVLSEAAQALHGEPDRQRVLIWAAQAAVALTGLPLAAVCLLPRDGSPIWSAIEGPVDFSVLADPRTLALLGRGLEAGEPTVVADVAEAEKALPRQDRIRRFLPLATLVVAPVLKPDGLAQATLVSASSDLVALDAATVEALMALAAHLGVALDNSTTLARMVEAETRGKEVVHALQEAVRPPAPVIPYTELGVHYVAADPSAPTGGDLYDWITLPDGNLHLVIVDVMGKGVEATKHAVSITHALRLLAFDGCPLGDLVARADALLSIQNPELVATLLVARYDPQTGALALAGAGHPPALVVSGGVAREVQAPGIPLGWPGAGSFEVVDVVLERSDTLVLYTDGLIEATKDILVGLEGLANAAVATASYPATAMARALVERQLADAARQDDSVALVLRRRAPSLVLPAHVLPPFGHHFTPQVAAVPVARHLLHDWLAQVPVDEASIDTLLLIVSELCSNAVRHATGAPGSVWLRAWSEGDAVHAEVSDDGAGLDWTASIGDELPDPEAEQGRGLFLVRQLADDVTTAVEDGRTVIRVVKRAVVGVDAPP